MNCSFNKKQFSFFIKQTLKYKTPFLIFYYNDYYKKKIGFIVSKNFGGAITRNLFKRQCRFLYYNNFYNCNSPYSLIIKPSSQNISYKNIKKSFVFFINHISER